MKKMILTVTLMFSCSALAGVCDTDRIVDTAIEWGNQHPSYESCIKSSHKVIFANAQAEKHQVGLACKNMDGESTSRTVTLQYRVQGQACIMTNGSIR